jgi:hypothetical protein
MTPPDPLTTLAARQRRRWARARVLAVVVVTLLLLTALVWAVRVASVSPVPV